MIAPFFIAGFDTPSDLCCRIRLYNKGLCPLIPEFIALGFRRSKKEQHQVLLLQTSNNNYGWNKYHAGIFGEVNSTPYPCKSKFQSEVWDNWNLIFQLTFCIQPALRLLLWIRRICLNMAHKIMSSVLVRRYRCCIHQTYMNRIYTVLPLF